MSKFVNKHNEMIREYNKSRFQKIKELNDANVPPSLNVGKYYEIFYIPLYEIGFKRLIGFVNSFTSNDRQYYFKECFDGSMFNHIFEDRILSFKQITDISVLEKAWKNV